MISELCSTFGCPPDVAERQDWPLARDIIDYRNAQAAVRLFNGSREDRARLGETPALMAILLEMQQAQGALASMDDIRADIVKKNAAAAEADEETFG